MAEGKGGRHVVVILSFDKMPEGGEVKASKDEILTMLKNTQPSQIEDAGFAYDKASSAIESAVNALEEHAGKILNVWKGPDASKARHALQMLHASGGELSTKLEMMGSALRQYASYLPETISKVEGISTNKSSDGDVPSSEIMVDDAANAKAAKAAADREAQQAMQELNKKIVDLYNVQVPHDVSYELPGVSIPGGTGTYRDPGYPDRVGINAGSGGSGSSGGSGGFDGGSGSGGSGSTGSTGNGTGSDGSRGSGSGDSSGSGSGDKPGSDSGNGSQNGSDSGDKPGSDSGNGDQNGSDSGGQGDSSSDGTGSQDPSKTGGSDTKDQTVPPVLGQDDKTSSDNVKGGLDPNGTEVSAYSPTTPTTTPTTVFNPTGNPVSTIAPNPVGVLSPTGTPSVPSVLGSPNGGMGAGGQGLAAAMRTSGNGMSGGMPFMPMGGGGASDQGDFERMTYLPADQDDWNSAHDVTDPVIC
ncbi:WXG100 family type VII secretion target [Nonomuraea sp. NPDC049141]|uniref:WXG100 family type VII secretion target n=1 Tax=unclassified Nonomuraea TaxID=2593643 RepID=UPI0033C09E2B